jgi:hypothetical protein
LRFLFLRRAGRKKFPSTTTLNKRRRNQMLKRTRVLCVLISLFILAFNVSFVAAAPPSPIHIEVLEEIGGEPPVPFTASGPVCASGMVDELSTSGNSPGGPYQTLWVTKQFVCGDGSGTFDISMVVKLNVNTGYTTANWKIIGGTGAYQNLKGNGKLAGTPNPGNTIFDVYDGKVH